MDYALAGAVFAAVPSFFLQDQVHLLSQASHDLDSYWLPAFLNPAVITDYHAAEMTDFLFPSSYT